MSNKNITKSINDVIIGDSKKENVCNKNNDNEIIIRKNNNNMKKEENTAFEYISFINDKPVEGKMQII